MAEQREEVAEKDLRKEVDRLTILNDKADYRIVHLLRYIEELEMKKDRTNELIRELTEEVKEMREEVEESLSEI